MIKKATDFLVKRRHILLCSFLLIAAISLLFIGQVNINYDLAEYLPENSRMKQGMQLMEKEFGPAASSQLRVMFTGLPEEKKKEVYDSLTSLEHVSVVAWEPGEEYNRDVYTLYEITTEYDSHSKEATILYNAVHERYDDYNIATGGDIWEANVPILPIYIIVAAVGLVLLILVLMCHSWFEPIVFLVNIGIAVAINLGTNVVFSDISVYTSAIVGILQLALSMDYSIILLNRYTQEKLKTFDNPSAMREAIASAFPAVAGSSLTTFAGLLCMSFMNFRLGADIGFALAKGVIVSLVCIFTVLPSLILISDPLIEKTKKKALHIPMAAYSRFVANHKIIFSVLFLVLFIGASFLKDNTQILYMLQTNNPVDKVFEPRHSLVLLYETKDSGRIAEIMAPIEEDVKVSEITGYYNTLGKAYRAEEIVKLFGNSSRLADENALSLMFKLYAAQNDSEKAETVTLGELIPFLKEHVMENPLFKRYLDDRTRKQIAEAEEMVRENAAKLEGEKYGRVLLTTIYPEDAPETRAFLRYISERCNSLLEGVTWQIGTSVMNKEMAQTFNSEMTRITIFSAIAIFIVVALTFHSLIISLVLVMTVQCGIYLTLTLIGLSGNGMYYLALLIVQCILMGSTIDYGIAYTFYFCESFLSTDIETTICRAYDGGLHTILTSALIMIVAPGILGFLFANPAIGEICLTISRGAISATLLVVFVLPGILVALGRFIRSERHYI